MPSITRGDLTFSCWRRSKKSLNQIVDWALKYRDPGQYHPSVRLDPRPWISGVRVTYRYKHEKLEKLYPHDMQEFLVWLHAVSTTEQPLTQIIGFVTDTDVCISFENLDRMDPHEFRAWVARYKKAFAHAKHRADQHPDTAPNGIKINISRGFECCPTDFVYEASEIFQIFKELSE